MEVRRFNAEGIASFQRFLDSCTTDTPLPYPQTALTDPTLSTALNADVELEPRSFSTRFELAEYLDRQFEAANFRPASSDTGMWSWIACFYFPQICPRNARGQLQPGRSARWIPQSSDWRRYYRHLVAAPYAIYRAHIDNPKRALALLCQKPGRPGDLVEQLASRQEIVTNPGLLAFATSWFVDPVTGKQRRIANSKGPGGPRRLVAVLQQFDLTWDLRTMSEEGFRQLLPAEFSRPSAEKSR